MILNSTHRQASLIRYRHMTTLFMNGLVLCGSFSTSFTKCISPLNFHLQPGKKKQYWNNNPLRSWEILTLRNAKSCIYSTMKWLIWKEEKRAGNASVKAPTHTLTEMQCRNCMLYGKHLKQFNFTFKQGERMKQKIRQVPTPWKYPPASWILT